MLQDFKTEIKLFLFVALIAVVISVAGILLLRVIQPAPIVQQTPPPVPQLQFIDTSTRYTDYRSDQEKVTEYLRENITDMVRSNLVLRVPPFFIPRVEFYEGNKVIATFIDDNRVVGYILGKYSVEDGRARVAYLDETLEKQDTVSLDELKQKYGFTELDTSSWQAYRNKEFGFEFLRPDMYSIHVSTERWGASFDEFVAKLSWEQDSKKVIVAGVPSVQGVRYYGGESGAWHLVTYIDLTPKAIISLGTWSGPEATKEERQEHEKILSTFRFIDSNNLSFLEDSFSAWGTYEGRLDLEIPRDYTRRDFKFDYPLNWIVNEFGLRHGAYISTFADGYIPDMYSDLLKISSDQGTAVISVQPWDRNKAYSLDRWVDGIFKEEVRISGRVVDMTILERGTASETESENIFIKYEVPTEGLEGKIIYVASEQERGEGAGIVYEFRLLYNKNDKMENKNTYEAVLKHILATFRFVE